MIPICHEDVGELCTHPPIIANARVHHKEGKPSDSAPRRMGGFPSCATSVAALSFVDTYNLFFEPIVVRTMTIVIDSKAPNSWPNAQAVYGECTVELEKWEQTLHGCLWKTTKGVAPCAVQVARTVLNGPNRARPHVQGVWLNYAIFPRLACRTDKSVLFNTAMLPLSGLQRHAASLVTIHRGHFLPTSASHEFPHPCLWAGRQHFAQENTPCSFSPLERGQDCYTMPVVKTLR